MILLLAMMTTLAVSCADGGDDVDTTDSIAITTQKDDTPENLRFDLDPDLNYNDETINVLAYENYFYGNNDETASDLSRAKYNQKAKTEDRLGVKFEYVDAKPYTEVSGMVTQSINTNTDDYQLVLGAAQNVVGLVNSGYFVSVNEMTHVDFDKAWWNRGYSESVSVNTNEPYVLFGDINYNMLERTTAVLFNKDLLLELHGMTDAELYDIVLDGKWTLDKFIELASGIFQDDGDSNTTNDVDDIHGVTMPNNSIFDFMVFSAGLEFTERDEDGYPVIADAPSERMVDIVDKLLPLFKGQDAFTTAGTAYKSNDYCDLKFAGGKALFMPNRFFVAGWASVRDMEDDYGIIPMPKYDETIDGYHCVVGANVIWALVPTTVEDVDMVSAVVESLAFEGYNEVTPTYFESNLKLKFTRGDDVDTESKMIDLVRDGARTDFLYINKLGNLGKIFTTCYDMNSNVVTSAYASYYVVAQQTLADIIAELED